MTSSELIKSIWEELKSETYELPGTYERRLIFNSAYPIYAGLIRPSNCIYISIAVSTSVAIKVLDHEVRGFKISKFFVPEENRVRVRIEISEYAYEEVFLIIASDLIDKLLIANEEGKAALVLNSRLAHWKRFMQSSGPDGLSNLQQIGLYGELLILKSMLKIPLMNNKVVASWVGPQGKNQDFLNNNTAIEVKTSATNDSTRVRISNEYQLDGSTLEFLVLCHVCLEDRPNAGIFLPDLIDEIYQSLEGELGSLFIETLAEMGYHSSQKSLYLKKGFIERSRTYYIVNSEFPKIISSSLNPSISQVSYQVDLNAAHNLKITEQRVFENFMEVTL